MPDTKEEKAKEREELLKKRRKSHRQRVKNIFYETGFTGMADHNVLEFLLFFGIPQKDTKELSYRLLEYFGSFERVLEADRMDLLKVQGMTDNAACMISMILPLYKYYVDRLEKGRHRVMPESLDKLADYIRSTFLKGTCREQAWVYCYDYRNCLIAKRCIAMGDISTTIFDIRALTSFVLETSCASVIIAHNHPHGITQPSNNDIIITRKVYNLLTSLKVRFVDHIIVTDKEYVSLANHVLTRKIFYNLEDDEPTKK